MKEIEEIKKEIETIIEKLEVYEGTMEKEKGPFTLFGLFLRDDAPKKFDLVVSADWIDRNKEESLKYIVNMVQKGLSKEELMKLSRVVLMNERSPFLEAIFKAIGGGRGIQLYNDNFYGAEIKYGYIIQLQRRRIK